MSSNRARRQASLTLDQKIGTRASDRFWEVKQALGKDRHGVMRYAEAYVDMASSRGGQEPTLYVHEDGWNGRPPDLPSGDPGRQFAYQPPSQRYRERYAQIDWSK